jgi:hypothetical protein
MLIILYIITISAHLASQIKPAIRSNSIIKSNPIIKTSILSFIYFAFALAQLILFNQSLPNLIDLILKVQAGQELIFK